MFGVLIPGERDRLGRRVSRLAKHIPVLSFLPERGARRTPQRPSDRNNIRAARFAGWSRSPSIKTMQKYPKLSWKSTTCVRPILELNDLELDDARTVVSQSTAQAAPVAP